MRVGGKNIVRGIAGTAVMAGLVVAIVMAPPHDRAAARSTAADVWTDPPYREVVRPPDEAPVEGRMLLIHGGGWHGDDPARVLELRARARSFARQGWLVWNVDYHSGRRSLRDVRRWQDLLAQRHERRPLCDYGRSAGGHLALMLTTRSRPDCVISEGGPTDLARIGERMRGRVRAVFGDRLARFSPLSYARWDPRRFRGTELMLGSAASDRLVPIAPVRELAGALPSRASFTALRPGPAPFVHGDVARADLRAYRRLQRRMLARLTKRAG